jgi:hypothetical protein
MATIDTQLGMVPETKTEPTSQRTPSRTAEQRATSFKPPSTSKPPWPCTPGHEHEVTRSLRGSQSEMGLLNLEISSRLEKKDIARRIYDLGIGVLHSQTELQRVRPEHTLSVHHALPAPISPVPVVSAP